MGLTQVLDISAAGMDVQQLRLQVAASNIANARTTSAPGTAPYQPLTVVVRASAPPGASAAGGMLSPAGLAQPFAQAIVPLQTTPKRVYEPGNPDADKDGFISLPGVDPISSMMDLLEISRSYEANLRAFDITRNLMQRTLDIGSKS
jgi:flagellar basal-body rod protein FlgC